MRIALASLRTLAIATCVLVSGLCLAQAPPPKPASARDAAAIKSFETNIEGYKSLRTQAAGTSPRPTNSPDKLVTTEQQMADKIRAVRVTAKQGDIFTEPIAAYFRRQIAITLRGPKGPKILASLRHAEPTKPLSLKVNDKYPEGFPLQSTPPSLLLNLPKLPKELQYRIVGSDLVLLDIAPNVIVDYLPHVIPQP